MQCPHCGFRHLSAQERCAKCKKPLTGVLAPTPPADESSTGLDGQHVITEDVTYAGGMSAAKAEASLEISASGEPAEPSLEVAAPDPLIEEEEARVLAGLGPEPEPEPPTSENTDEEMRELRELLVPRTTGPEERDTVSGVLDDFFNKSKPPAEAALAAVSAEVEAALDPEAGPAPGPEPAPALADEVSDEATLSSDEVKADKTGEPSQPEPEIDAALERGDESSLAIDVPEPDLSREQEEEALPAEASMVEPQADEPVSAEAADEDVWADDGPPPDDGVFADGEIPEENGRLAEEVSLAEPEPPAAEGGGDEEANPNAVPDDAIGRSEESTGELFAKTLREVTDALNKVKAEVAPEEMELAAEAVPAGPEPVLDREESSHGTNSASITAPPPVEPLRREDKPTPWPAKEAYSASLLDLMDLKRTAAAAPPEQAPPMAPEDPPERSEIDVYAGPAESSASASVLPGTESRSFVKTGDVSALFSRVDYKLLGRRLGAGLIDLAVWCAIGIALFLGARLISGNAPLHGSAYDWGVLVILPIVVMTGILALVYGGLFQGLTGRTPGMMLFGLQLAASGGQKPAVHQAFIRAGLFVVSLLPLGLGLLPAAVSSESFLDRISGTEVTRV